MPAAFTPQEIEEKIASAERILKHTFTDKELIRAAITHPSAIDDGHVERTYERLEFLGDSVVGAITAAAIFRKFPEMDEGGMTRIKVSLVSGETLSKIADSLGISDVIIFGGSEAGTGRRGLHSALENVFESMVAALYLDSDLPTTIAWLSETLGPYVDAQNASEPENPKSTLQELLQSRRITPSYETVAIEGPPHAREFTSNALANGKVIGTGKGSSKKQSEANAALDALKRYEDDVACSV